MPRLSPLLVALLLAPLGALAQMQPDAGPAAQALRLTAGTAGSATFDVRAVSESGLADCPGYVDPSAPDVVLDWGGGDLRVWVRAPFDATLLVAGPDGEWSCNDDAEGTSPVVEMEEAPPGRYAVWLGSFSPDPYETEATLFAGSPPPPPVLDPEATPAAGTVAIAGGFEAEQGILEINVQAGGPDGATSLDLADDVFCSGFLDAARPTAVLDYEADGGTGALVISASGVDADLVLLVSGPDGTIRCNDDFQGSDPLVEITDPADGPYAVWVGTFNAGAAAQAATLVVSETPPPAGDFVIDDDMGGAPYSEGTYSVLDLTVSPAATLALDDEETSVDVVISPTVLNPVQGPACGGHIDNRPTVGLTLSGEGPVAVTATSDLDLVMVLLTPGGMWFCSDDAYDFDPGVQIDEPGAGTYKVWVGTYGEMDEAVDATVTIARGELEVSESSFSSEPLEVDPQSDGTYEDMEIRTGGAATTVRVGETASVRPGGPILNPVAGLSCSGFVSERPTATFSANGRVEVSASADVDLTLVLQTPTGAWFCSDDADGTDPHISISEGGDGEYSVWVGTFSRLTNTPDAELTVEVGTDAMNE